MLTTNSLELRGDRYIILERPQWEHEITALKKIEEILSSSRELGDYKILLGYYVGKVMGYSLESDAILICKFGLFVIELKDYFGKITIMGPNTMYILQEVSKTKEKRLKNPVSSVKYRVRSIQSAFPKETNNKVYIMGLLLFTNPSSHVIVQTRQGNVPFYNENEVGIGHLKDILQLIKITVQTVSGGKTYSDQEIRNVVRALTDHRAAMKNNDNQREDSLIIGPYKLHKKADQLNQQFDYELFEGVVMDTEMPVWVKVYRLGALYTKDELVKQVEICVRDAAALQRVSGHPHVIACLSHHVTEDYRYVLIAYRKEEGTWLSELDMGQLSLGQRLKLMEQLIDAVNYIHENQILHRAINPENILVGRRGAKIINFDLARIQNQATLWQKAKAQSEIQAGQAYMAPEIKKAQKREDIHTPSDIYSLGITFGYILRGETPLGDTWIEDLQEQLSDVTDQFWELLIRMTEQQSHNRPSGEDVFRVVAEEAYLHD